MKALEMMIQLSAGMNFDAGNMLIGPHTPNKSSSNLNDGRLILLAADVVLKKSIFSVLSMHFGCQAPFT